MTVRVSPETRDRLATLGRIFGISAGNATDALSYAEPELLLQLHGKRAALLARRSGAKRRASSRKVRAS